MARGIAIGVIGREDYSDNLMTYHPAGVGTSADFFHNDEWLDFNGVQSSHGILIKSDKVVGQTYVRTPVKPVIDLETSYAEIMMGKQTEPVTDDMARRSAYWAVFAGGCGHTYGHTSIWQMFVPNGKRTRGMAGATTPWPKALDAPSAAQMGHLRKLMESLPFVTRIPDQSIITSDTGKQGDHLLATRDQEGTYAMVYSPTGGAFSLNTSWMTGSKGKAWWFNPRDGKANAIGDVPRNAEQKYSPPTQGEGQDWVLVIADSNLAFPAEEH